MFTFWAKAVKVQNMHSATEKMILQKNTQKKSIIETNDKPILLGPFKTFYPKVLNLCRAMAGLLTRSFPEPSRQPEADSGKDFRKLKELTAAGTVQDLHLIPILIL